ncbi:hypothetical protein [Streptomyces sp. KL116D]|uniref:hypothetical protein n=1 Tax=Streptomyces sp. KL116D TaxID=3045152 RepID=UPI003557247E
MTTVITPEACAGRPLDIGDALREMLLLRTADLIGYQDATYAARHTADVADCGRHGPPRGRAGRG